MEHVKSRKHLADLVVSGVRENGLYVAKDILSAKQCAYFKDLLEAILLRRAEENQYIGSKTYQVLYHYFSYDFRLIDLVDHPLIHEVMKELIDGDFVLISPSARNPQIKHLNPKSTRTSGVGWHNDARYTSDGNSAFQPSLNYYAVVMLETFSVENGATQIISGSHKFYKRPEGRDLKASGIKSNRISHMVGPTGSIAFFDAALWHAVGKSSKNSRWGVFNMYGPWFMKPYYDFSCMFTDEQFESMTPLQRQLLHYDSRPVPNIDAGFATLRRIRDKLAEP